MKRSGVLLLGLCLLGVAGCSDDEPTNPSNLPIVLTASLSPANEVPAIANAENTGHGAVQVTFNVTRDANGAITGGSADFHFQLSGFPSGTAIQTFPLSSVFSPPGEPDVSAAKTCPFFSTPSAERSKRMTLRPAVSLT